MFGLKAALSGLQNIDCDSVEKAQTLLPEPESTPRVGAANA